MKNPAWTKLTPLERKLEMRRRAVVRRNNRRDRRARLIESAKDLLAATDGSAFAFPHGLK